MALNWIGHNFWIVDLKVKIPGVKISQPQKWLESNLVQTFHSNLWPFQFRATRVLIFHSLWLQIFLSYSINFLPVFHALYCISVYFLTYTPINAPVFSVWHFFISFNAIAQIFFSLFSMNAHISQFFQGTYLPSIFKFKVYLNLIFILFMHICFLSLL